MTAPALVFTLAAVAAPVQAEMIAECQDLAYVAKAADVIVQGVVTDVEAREEKGGGVFTYVRVKRSRYLKGRAGRSLVLKLRGGTNESKGITVSDADTPTFKKGEKGFFYLERIGRYYAPVCGWGASERAPETASGAAAR